MRHLLVPTDFSETAKAALEYAVEFCRHFDGRITLLHVLFTDEIADALSGLDAIGYLSSAMNLPTDSSRCVPSYDVEGLRRIAQRRMNEGIDPTWRESICFETAVEEGRPAVRIAQYAQEHAVDLIVMGTHGRGPVARFFLGSVAENVLRSASCPVLTVRRKPATRGDKTDAPAP